MEPVIYTLTPFQATTPTDVGVSLNIPNRIGTGASTRAAYNIRNTSASTAGVCVTGTTTTSVDTCIILDCALQGGLEGPGKTSAIYLGWQEETILEPHASWPHLADRAIPQAVGGSGQTIYPVLLINGPTLITGDTASPIFGWDFNTETQEDVVIGYDTSSGKGLDVRGTLTKSAGSFKIDHPDPAKTETHTLWHSFVESPTAGDNLYRYRVTTKNKKAMIRLPDYFKFLNVDEMTWVSPVKSFGRGYAVVNQEQTYVEVVTDEDSEYNVLIIATRKDKDVVKNWKGVERLK